MPNSTQAIQMKIAVLTVHLEKMYALMEQIGIPGRIGAISNIAGLNYQINQTLREISALESQIADRR